jgi:hypothetical protein
LCYKTIAALHNFDCSRFSSADQAELCGAQNSTVVSRVGASEELYRAAVQPRTHAVAVEFDFVQPLRPFGRLADQSGELRFDLDRTLPCFDGKPLG